MVLVVRDRVIFGVCKFMMFFLFCYFVKGCWLWFGFGLGYVNGR